MKWLCEKTKRKKYLRCPLCKACEIVDLEKEAPATCRCGVTLDGEAASTWVTDLKGVCEKQEWYIDRYKPMSVFIECPACGKGFKGTVLDPIPDKCHACGSENEGGGYLNIVRGNKRGK